MASPIQVSQLTTFILAHLTEEDAGRVALYHYLKNFCRENEPVQPTLINQFFSECLQMAFWQERKNELHKDVKDLLSAFYTANRVALSLDPLWDLSKMQIIGLTQNENLYHTVKNFETALVLEAETLRLINESDTRVIALKKNSQGQISVRTYNNQVRIQGYQLYPLAPDQELSYNPLLELNSHVVQRVKLTPHLQVRFEINDDGVIAQSISGYAFRQSQILRLAHLGEFPALFYHLKRLERFYVYRTSDPYYVELVSTLDKALQLIQTGEPGAEAFARNVFESAQIAFDQVFPDDKTLYIKLKELAKGMTLQKPRANNLKQEV